MKQETFVKGERLKLLIHVINPEENSFVTADGLLSCMRNEPSGLNRIYKIDDLIRSSRRSRLSVLSSPPSRGENVLGFYQDNFYRAIVLESDVASARIWFTDYGNIATVALKDLRVLPREMAKEKAVSILCKLDGSLVESQVREFNDELSRKKRPIAELRFIEKIEDLHGGYSVEVLLDAKDHISVSPSKIFFAVIESFVHLGDFWICPSVETNEQKTLKKNMASYNSEDIPLCAEPPTVGTFVAAKYEGDYYRAEVLSVSGNSLRLVFMDYGNMANTGFSKVKILKKNDIYAAVPQSTRCCLKNYEDESPVDWPEDRCRAVLRDLPPQVECQVLSNDKTGEKSIVELWVGGQPFSEQMNHKGTDDTSFEKKTAKEERATHSHPRTIEGSHKRLDELEDRMRRLEEMLATFTKSKCNIY